MSRSFSSVVLAIFGPTASGKSAVAEAIADRIPAELISADSMQVYRGLPILTNQSPRAAHLVAIWELDHEGSVGEYQTLAHAAIDGVLAGGKTPLVVGGTGLYLRAAIGDLALPPPATGPRRAHFEEVYDQLGGPRAHELLGRRDPNAAARIHPNDRRRVVRALELAETGSSLSPEEDTLWNESTRHPTLLFGLDLPRDVLHERIEARTDEMFEAGVEDEVRRALERPISATARQMHGLSEIGELPRDEARDALIVRTRQYAAYQRKWMRRIPGIVMVDADRPPGEIADEIVQVARSRERLPAH